MDITELREKLNDFKSDTCQVKLDGICSLLSKTIVSKAYVIIARNIENHIGTIDDRSTEFLKV